MKEIFWRFDWLSLIIISFFTRIIPFFLHGSHPLGYDMGFYRHYSAQSFSSFPNTPTTGLASTDFFPRLLLDSLRIFISNPDIIIHLGLIIAFLFATLGFRFFLSQYAGREVAFLGGLLFIFSPVQYVGYWFFLLKNYVALAGLFFSFAFLKDIEDKKDLYSKLFFIASFFFVLLSQTTTSILGVMVFCIYFSFQITRGRAITKTFFLLFSSLSLGLLFFFRPTLFTKIITFQPTAIFLEWPEYLSLAYPSIFLFFSGFFYFHKKVFFQYFLPTIFLFVVLLLSLLELPFYQRLFLFLDISILFFDAVILMFFIRNYSFFSKRLQIGTIFVAAIFMGFFLGKFLSTIAFYHPLITPNETVEMQKNNSLTEKEATILTTSDYMPFVYGFSSRNVFAPGLREYKYNLEDWEKFWFEMTKKEKIQFLSVFPRPLYFFTDPKSDENFLEAECVVKKSQYLSEFGCK